MYILYIHSTWNQSKCKMELPVRNLIGCLYNLYQAPRRTRHLRYICINFYTQPIKMLMADILNAIWLVACTICTRLVVELDIRTHVCHHTVYEIFVSISTRNQSKCRMQHPKRNLIGCLYNLYQARRRTRYQNSCLSSHSLRNFCINFYTQPIKMQNDTS